MNSLIDIIIIYICTSLYILVNELSTKAIVSILIILTLVCLVYYFDNKYVSLITVGLFVIFTLYSPIYFFYLPLFLYLHYNIKPYLMELVCIFLLALVYEKYGFTTDSLSVNGYFFVICLCILAYMLTRKTYQIHSLQENNHRILDIHSSMQQDLQRTQKEQRMEQDREIHLATLAERNRIAREIHDNVGHMLSRSILQLGAILMINKNETLKEPLNNLKDTLNTAMDSIRESVHDLRDESLDLEPMILNMTKEFPDLNVKLDYDMSNHASKDIKYCFLAILKEAMTNTIKHSNANAIEITIREHPALYQLLVQDNGTSEGSQRNDTSNCSGMGLDNMRERVTALGGTITIASDNGFRIFIVIQKPK